MGLIVTHALLRALLLRGVFEEELEHLTGGQVGGQVIKGAVALALGASAIRFATGGEALDVGGAEQVRRDGELAQQGGLALAQGQGGGAAEFVYLGHY